MKPTGRPNGRPANPNSKWFLRQLKDAEKLILLAAGDGDMSAGFMEALDLYRHCYNLGLRPGVPLEAVTVATLPDNY